MEESWKEKGNIRSGSVQPVSLGPACSISTQYPSSADLTYSGPIPLGPKSENKSKPTSPRLQPTNREQTRTGLDTTPLALRGASCCCHVAPSGAVTPSARLGAKGSLQYFGNALAAPQLIQLGFSNFGPVSTILILPNLFLAPIKVIELILWSYFMFTS